MDSRAMLILHKVLGTIFEVSNDYINVFQLHLADNPEGY